MNRFHRKSFVFSTRFFSVTYPRWRSWRRREEDKSGVEALWKQKAGCLWCDQTSAQTQGLPAPERERERETGREWVMGKSWAGLSGWSNLAGGSRLLSLQIEHFERDRWVFFWQFSSIDQTILSLFILQWLILWKCLYGLLLFGLLRHLLWGICLFL